MTREYTIKLQVLIQIHDQRSCNHFFFVCFNSNLHQVKHASCKFFKLWHEKRIKNAEFNASDTIWYCGAGGGFRTHDLQIMSIALHGEAGTLGQAELLRHEIKSTVC